MMNMISVLFATVLFWTGLTVQLDGGVVTGILLDSAGMGLPNVRVAALAVDQTTNTEVLVSIAYTDGKGAYRLEVPVGRYYVVAGRVDMPTYYPGVFDRRNATSLSVARQSSQTLNFTVSAPSLETSTTNQLGYNTVIVGVDRWLFRETTSRVLPTGPSELIPFLRTYPGVSGTTTFIFELAGVSGETLLFRRDPGRFSYGCTGCSFFVTAGAVSAKGSEPSVSFKLSAAGQTLSFTCHATTCHVAKATPAGFMVSTINRNESGIASISDKLGFAVIP